LSHSAKTLCFCSRVSSNVRVSKCTLKYAVVKIAQPPAFPQPPTPIVFAVSEKLLQRRLSYGKQGEPFIILYLIHPNSHRTVAVAELPKKSGNALEATYELTNSLAAKVCNLHSTFAPLNSTGLPLEMHSKLVESRLCHQVKKMDVTSSFSFILAGTFCLQERRLCMVKLLYPWIGEYPGGNKHSFGCQTACNQGI
jgi:hypothetical protein